VHAKNHDYKSFYSEEIKLRKALAYPPYTSLASLIISGTNEQEVIKLAYEISQFLDSIKHRYGNVEKLGPSAAAIARIKNRFRWQIVLKSTEEENLRKMLAAMLEKNFEGQSNASISIDINPQSMI
jgi:primosomal protein N' (replication factor Y)